MNLEKQDHVNKTIFEIVGFEYLDHYFHDGMCYARYSMTDEDGKKYEFQKVFDVEEDDVNDENVVKKLKEAVSEELLVDEVFKVDPFAKPNRNRLPLELDILIKEFLDCGNCCYTIDEYEDFNDVLEAYKYDGNPTKFLKQLTKIVEEYKLNDVIEFNFFNQDPLVTVYPGIVEMYKEPFLVKG